MAGVGIGEQEIELALLELGPDRAQLLGDLLAELGIALRQLIELDDVAGATLELLPRGRELAIFERLARAVARRRGIVPRARFG